MQKGLIIGNVTNLYYIEVDGTIYECSARGKIKLQELEPVVGDYVSVEILDEENSNTSKNLEMFSNNYKKISNKKAVICDILDRNTYIKRPKIANLTRNCFCGIYKQSCSRFITFR